MRKTSSTLIAAVLMLLLVGIVMLASTSSVKGTSSFHDPHFFLKRQLGWLALSLVVSGFLVLFDYHVFKKLALPMGVLSVVLLIVVLIPGLGVQIGGSRRWFRLAGFSLQPSELAKFTSVVAMSAWIVHTGGKMQRFWDGAFLPVLGLAFVCALLLGEPDFGTTLLTAMVGMAILFLGGAKVLYLGAFGVVGVSGFMLMILADPVRRDRIFAFLMPEKYPATAYHLAQSKIAFISGGWWGVGLGNSIQKQFYLPEAHNDFILAIIGEELGFVATLSVVLLFACCFACGVLITLRAPDLFGRLLAGGLTLLISLQASITIGVVTGCLPTKGLPLPFISYGGSSLLVSMMAVGVLVNIAAHGVSNRADEHTRLIKDSQHHL
jgi:cell division protein FtsW